MAYRYEKNLNGEQDLVFDGFENGIADSPFVGVGNIRNLNVRYYEGVAYMNYKRQAATIQSASGSSTGTFTVTVASPAVFTSNNHGLVLNETITFTTTGALPTGLSTGVTYYVISAGLTANDFEVSTTRGGAAINTSGTQSGVHTFTVVITKPLWSAQSPAGLIYVADDNRNIWKQVAVNGSVFGRLAGNNANTDIGGLAFWNNYLISIGAGSGTNGRIEICGDGNGDSGVTSSNWNNTQPTQTFTVTVASPAVFTAVNHGLSVGDRIRLSTTGALPTGLSTSIDYFIIAGGLTADTFEVSLSSGGSAINTSGSQSGVHTLTWNTGVWPIVSGVTVTVSSPPAADSTTVTGLSYADGSGITRDFWNSPSGFYPLRFTQGSVSQIVLANFTQGSNVITWFPALNRTATTTETTLLTNAGSSTAVVDHMSLISANTADLYYCNGPYVGAFTLDVNQTFNKSDMSTFTFYANILALPTAETATWLSELQSQLVIGGVQKIYPWNFVDSSWGVSVPLPELSNKIINLLNNLYVFAGNKGNIYLSNGYSVQHFKKIPDYISGAIDPAWTFGDVMVHKRLIYFQATATNSQTGVVILQGNFSLNTDTGSLVLENQNSGGLLPSGATSDGLLIDNTSTSINYDKYYSAYGASVSRIDFNDTTPYSNNEAVIETDIAPIGTALQPKTYSSAEFKLDRPMRSGDSISLYARQSLSDSYTLIGTTTSAVLSLATTPLSFQNWQWIQLMATMSCNATAISSSFTPIRQIRIR